MKKQESIQELQETGGNCAGIHELIDWQVIQYRKAVVEHRLDLSKAEGRCVAWQEAEKDFNSSDRSMMGEKWRVEYCGGICERRNKCLLALNFLKSRKTAPLYRAG